MKRKTFINAPVGDGVQTPYGVALGPLDAAICAADRVRVLGFWDALRKHIAKQTHVLYIGPGPLAPLIWESLMRTDATFHLVEINDESRATVAKMLEPWIKHGRVTIEGGDASEIELPEADVAVIECMASGLHREPQVAITQNVLRQHPNIKLVPERIVLRFSGGQELEFDRDTVLQEDPFRVRAWVDDMGTVMIRTFVETARQIWLPLCSLTLDFPVFHLPPSTWQWLEYEISEIPQWKPIDSPM